MDYEFELYEDSDLLTRSRSHFVNKQVEIWGFDYISDLFDRGYEPLFIKDDDDGYKWTWYRRVSVPGQVHPLSRA